MRKAEERSTDDWDEQEDETKVLVDHNRSDDMENFIINKVLLAE